MNHKDIDPAEVARSRGAKLAPRPTARQINYLSILLTDCGFSRIQRNDYLSTECEREVKFLDELTAAEASRLIGHLEERRRENW